MRIDIQSRGFTLTEAMRQHVERRLRFALCAMRQGPKAIAVRLGDENGPRGGVDKVCTIQISFSGAAPVIIEEVQADLYAAVDRAADRAGRTVIRRLQRLHRMRRSNLGSGNFADTESREASPA